MKKLIILMNRPIYLGLYILDLSKPVLYKFRYDYIKSKYVENAKLYYMDTDSFIAHVKINDIYMDFAEYVEKRFDASSFEIDRSLPMEKN